MDGRTTHTIKSVRPVKSQYAQWVVVGMFDLLCGGFVFSAGFHDGLKKVDDVGYDFSPATNANPKLVGAENLPDVAADFGGGASTHEAKPNITDGYWPETTVGFPQRN